MKSEDDNKASNKILKIFNYIGGTLIFFGIGYFITDNWYLLGVVLRLLTTLGVACASFYLAILLCRENKHRYASTVFFMLAGLLFPLGISVFLNSLNLMINPQLDDIIISGICLSIFWAAYTVYRRDVLLLFSIIFGSFFYIVLTQYIGEHTLGKLTNEFVYYQGLILGICYVFLGYYLNEDDTGLAGALYLFGDLLILWLVFQLGGWLWSSDYMNVFWAWATPFVLILNFMLSIYLRSRAFLYLGTIFLIVFISSVTSKFAYLFGHLGWPLILIISGFGLMLLGYAVSYLHKRIR